jgi:hypothetical protein
MTQYIDKSALVAEINGIVKALNRQNPDPLGNHAQCLAAAEIEALNLVKDIIDDLEVKEDAGHYELKEFAKIIRGNLTGISKDVQSLFEAKYLQLTGNKMYGGYND